MRIKCRGIEFRIRYNFCNFFACSSFRVDKVSVAFAILNILLGIATLYGSISNFPSSDAGEDEITVVSFSVGIGIASVILNIVASAFVIYGYWRRNPGFYLPYMMNNAIVSIVMCLFIVLGFIAILKMNKSNDTLSVFLLTTTLTYQILRTLIIEYPAGNLFSIALIVMLLLFVFITYPIFYIAYKSLNNDLQQRLGSTNETMTDSTRQQGQLMPPTALDIATVEVASYAEMPCTLSTGQDFAGTNTAAERASLHESMTDYKVI